MLLLRNIAFYLAFYLGSIVVTSGTLLALPFSRELFRRLVHSWSAWHRWCVTHLLGCEVVIEGKPPSEPVLYAVKHESFFEAIDTPKLFPLPAV
ncbi:MAG: 1-acyl-sn-glycerol-3-phosphate acyltransferase, partial [Alphaproteobacteria bacterium]|nr:1-acyl-sn-glycerol-3-phosphate acyltransferase [Alphaproteobacteria bacterium]